MVTVEPKYTIAEKLVNSEYNVMLNGATLHESGRFEGDIANLVDMKGFGADIGGNWASQSVNSGAGDAFIIIDLAQGYTLNQIEAMYIQWKNNDQTLPTDGFKIMVANDANYDITLGTGTVIAGGAEIPVVTADNSNWKTVFDSDVNNATNATGTYDWEVTETGCLSVLPFSNDSYTGTFNHIKIAFDYEGADKPWGVQAYEIALLINDEAPSEGPEMPSEEVTTTEVQETTTAEPGVEQPVVPFGVEVGSPEDNSISVVMGNPGNGQTYNVYLNGEYYTNVTLGYSVFTGIPAGTYTVKSQVFLME